MTDEKKKYINPAQTEQKPQNSTTEPPKTASGRDANGNLIDRPMKNPFESKMEIMPTIIPEGGMPGKRVWGEIPDGGEPSANPRKKPDGATTPGSADTGGTGAGGTDISTDSYMEALGALQNAQKAIPTYAGTYDAQLDEIYNQIINRDKFSYDLNADMLYEQYKDQYVNLGRMAMKDTMGQAAALTGGYGSSYGQAVGQQQYDAYLQQLNDVIPELYDRALNSYNAEGDRLMNMYSMTGDMAADEYAKYQDSLDRYWQDRDRAYNEIISLITSTGYMPTAEELAAAGLTQEQADALVKTWRAENPDIAYDNGTITAEEYKQITGKYPKGYKKPGSGGGGGGGGGTATGNKTLKEYAQDLIDQGYTPREVNDAISQAPGYSPEEKREALIVGIGGVNDPYDR